MSAKSELTDAQREVCARFGVRPCAAPRWLKVGIARNGTDGLLPINGLRHPPEGDTTGWYIWAGDTMSDADDFFVPLHVEHLDAWCPAIVAYLALPPGWRVLLAPGHEDVWQDAALLG